MNKEFGIKLAKLLISTAWSDGQIQDDEKVTLAKLRAEYPGITEEEWVTLKLYMEYPMTRDEVKVVLEDIRNSLVTSEDRELAVKWLQELVHADGKVEYNEFRFYKDVVDFIEGNNDQIDNLQGKFSKGETSDRESEIDDFLNNPVFFRVCRAFKEKRMEISAGGDDLRRRCLEASLIARIAKSDEDLHQDEYEGMIDLLTTYLNVPLGSAIEIVNQSLNMEDDICSIPRICKKYLEFSNEQERKEFVILLVEMIYVDNIVEPREVDMIHEMAGYLDVPSAFVDQKMEEYSK
jgi:uncharacterized tellurite resistance protein B-like protein